MLHYIPACERKEREQNDESSGFQGQTNNVPLHTVHLEEFLPELQALIAHFGLSYDVQKLRNAADEMELFSMVTSLSLSTITGRQLPYEVGSRQAVALHLSHQVWREFRTVFRQQEQMKTFPQYDGTQVKQSQWGRSSAGLALRKEANWIPHIQVGVKNHSFTLSHLSGSFTHFTIFYSSSGFFWWCEDSRN